MAAASAPTDAPSPGGPRHVPGAARTQARTWVAPVLLVGCAVAAIVALTWRMHPTQATVVDDMATSAMPIAPRDTPRASHRLPPPAPDPRLSAVATRQRLLGRDPAIPAAIAAGRKKLAQRYAGEPVDAVWARRKEQALASANDAPQIGALGAKPLAFDARCRASVCLVAADFASTLAADDWISLYTLVAGPEVSRAAIQRSINPDGSIHLQMYASAR